MSECQQGRARHGSVKNKIWKQVQEKNFLRYKVLWHPALSSDWITVTAMGIIVVMVTVTLLSTVVDVVTVVSTLCKHTRTN